MSRRALRVCGLAALAVPVAGAGPAYACSCVPESDRTYLGRAEAVFEGRTPVRPRGPGFAGVVTFTVTRVHKGPVLPEQPVETGTDTCGWEPHARGPWLVFASRNGGEHLEADVCSGTRLLADGPPVWDDDVPGVLYGLGGAGLLAVLLLLRRRRRSGAGADARSA
jgi:hypothetical protein